MPPGFEHDLDFTRFLPEAVYNFIWTTGRGFDLINESLYVSLKQFFEEVYTRDKNKEINRKLCELLTIKQMERMRDMHPKVKNDMNFITVYFQKIFHEELSLELQDMISN